MLLVGNQMVCMNISFSHYISYLNFNITSFMPNISIKFNNTPLIVERINFATKIVNAYIVYDLDNCPKILLRKFTIRYVLVCGK